MSGDEHFLARWSRRKRAVARTPPPPARVAKRDGDEPDAKRSPALAPAEPPAEAPAFDLAQLPSIDSITAATDIRPFLAAGVPEELKHAALRRAWLVDPTVRNFVGLAENQWDFTAPGAAPGFGALIPADDVRRLVARVLGDEPAPQSEPLAAQDVTRETTTQVQNETEESARPPACTAAQPVGDVRAAAPVRRSSEPSKEQFVMAQKREEDTDNIAMQNHSTSDERKMQPGKRKHGRALPT